MGFMDKAKKMAEQAAAQGKVLAEQAQTKLDEVQSDFNQKQTAGQATEPAVEYDKHGRVTGETAPPATPASPAAAAPAPPADGEASAVAPAVPGQGDPTPLSGAGPVPTDQPLADAPPAAPPAPPAAPSSGSGLTSGDPLAG